jgi:hypothetical protein
MASCLTRLHDVNSPILFKVKSKVVVGVVNVAIVKSITGVAMELMFFPEKFHVRLINLGIRRKLTCYPQRTQRLF